MSITQYLMRRLIQLIPVLIIISIVVFVVMRLSGDVAALLLPEDYTQDELEALQRALGLDRPLYVQYGYFIRDAVQGDFGRSFRYNMPALPLVLERLPLTIKVTFTGILVAVLIAVPAGVMAALRQNSAADLTTTSLAVVGRAMPNFWVGIMLILVFAVMLRWLPVSGYQGPKYLILPAISLGTGAAAVATRLMRSSMLEVLRLEYIMTARAKGLSQRVVVYKHALRNALIPVVTVVGLQTAALLGGAIITEQIFSLPGLGRLMVQALNGRDMAVVQAGVVVFAVVVMSINLLIDLLYTLIDPRIRYASGK